LNISAEDKPRQENTGIGSSQGKTQDGENPLSILLIINIKNLAERER